MGELGGCTTFSRGACQYMIIFVYKNRSPFEPAGSNGDLFINSKWGTGGWGGTDLGWGHVPPVPPGIHYGSSARCACALEVRRIAIISLAKLGKIHMSMWSS